MLKPTDWKLERLIALRDIAIPFVQEREQQSLLNFDVFEDFAGCGTAHCLLGWLPSIPYFKERGWRSNHALPPFCTAGKGIVTATEWFGLKHSEYVYLFGSGRYGSARKDLDHRKAYLNEIIEQRVAAHAA